MISGKSNNLMNIRILGLFLLFVIPLYLYVKHINHIKNYEMKYVIFDM